MSHFPAAEAQDAEGRASGPGHRNVLVTGGSGASGIAVARALRAAGHRVFTVGSDQARIDAAAQEAGDGVTPLVCDLARIDEVRQLRQRVTAAAGTVDAVIHLVGGWRGAKGIPDQTDVDWDFLETGAITTLRNVSRVFFEDIASSPRGRFAMVSSTALEQPTAAGKGPPSSWWSRHSWTTGCAAATLTGPSPGPPTSRNWPAPSSDFSKQPPPN